MSRIFPPTRALAALLPTLLLTACPVEEVEDRAGLYAITAAPPALEARVNNTPDAVPTITLTEGAALGVACWSTCEDECEGASLTAEPEDALEILPAYATRYTYSDNFVLIAKKRGAFSLRVETSCATTLYRVDVPAQPASP